jgi:biopolymer transport protein TolQ
MILNATLFSKVVLLILLGFSIISWAIMIQKYFYVRKYKDDSARFLHTLTNQGTLVQIEECCIHFSAGVAKAMPAFLLKLIRGASQGKPVFAPESILNSVTMGEVATLQYGMGLLATAASVSPLMGLLGTVWGVMFSFMNIGQTGTASIAAVAPGIAEALLATIAGLVVAIPAMAGHNLLQGYINQCLDNLDRDNEISLSMFRKGTKA